MPKTQTLDVAYQCNTYKPISQLKNTIERYICVMAIIYATCYAPTYFRRTQDTSLESTSLVPLKATRNRRNFRCARSRVAILLAAFILINARRRQTKRTLPTSMLCSSVVKVFSVPKRGTVIDKTCYVRICRKPNFENLV